MIYSTDDKPTRGNLDDKEHNCIFIPQQCNHFTRRPPYRIIILKVTFRKQIPENDAISSNYICVYSDFTYADLLHKSWSISFY